MRFANGSTKQYNVGSLMDRLPMFEALKDAHLFEDVQVDVGGYGVVWNDELDLSCDELWDHGIEVQTPFDGLMSFSDASELWGLSESALRKAVAYGKIAPGVDARKFGKQWVVTRDAMYREYGDPERTRPAAYRVLNLHGYFGGILILPMHVRIEGNCDGAGDSRKGERWQRERVQRGRAACMYP